MSEYQEEAITDGAGWLHEPGETSENRFLETVGLGSDTLIPPYSLQISGIFSDRIEIYNASFSKALKSNVRIASNATTPKITGNNDVWIHIGFTVIG